MTDQSLEIYVLAEERWMLHEKFTGGDESVAQNAAEQVFRNSNVTAVKLIREAFDEEKEAYVDIIVFQKSKNDAILALDKETKIARQKSVSKDLTQAPEKKESSVEISLPQKQEPQGLLAKIVLVIKAFFGAEKPEPKQPKKKIKTSLSEAVEKKEPAPVLELKEDETNEDGTLLGSDDEVLSQATIAVMNLMTDSLTYLHHTNYHRLPGGQFSEYDRFGCCLFLAGIISYLAEMNELSDALKIRIIEKCMALVTNDPMRSLKFSEEFEQYLVTPRYLNIFKAGSTVMQRKIEGYEDAGPYLAAALDKWNAAANSGDSDNMVFVMFTDIVDSTSYTQERGDLASFDLVRAHNRIVRKALEVYHGREVKHTGDGIMAAFSVGENAVKACIDIQKGVHDQNKIDDELGLHLRIGVDGGSPVVEGEDLFGATVQLAARICNLAEGDEILISQNLQVLCDEDKFDIVSYGDHEFKGFEEKLPVYKVNFETETKTEEVIDLGEEVGPLDVLQPVVEKEPEVKQKSKDAAADFIKEMKASIKKDMVPENSEENESPEEEKQETIVSGDDILQEQVSDVFAGDLPEELQQFMDDDADDSNVSVDEDKQKEA